ncbi:TlpA disulfide reductase family protein [Sulfuriroseicoccus oceanibius]|uniref:TlpA family protein disulfide reductase n=1 Tax=Sulfuriroseicoccus oceanibius TaxID=2707525 RepID=A0A6B3LDZ5_9BACT|nr:TlpA disulfide reductase family protein [Sulfuriroseicoccus oceanibius]QQL44738.1 TlpA family protein disulfide reductase [Sulfuriroseicoccus oceanibius]
MFMISPALIKRSSLLLAMAVSLSSTGLAQEAKSDSKLTLGSPVPSLDLEGVKWVKGEPVKTLDEEGKVYMLECWATWCGPCIVAIPHVNELHQKYGDKGLVVIGMSSLEDDLAKVEKFVENRGDGMSYRVAFSGGRKSEFSKQWLKAAGVKGIPHTFLVKNGTLVLMSHPADVDDALIENLLSGDFDEKAFAARLADKKAREAEVNSKVYPMAQNGQWNELEAYARKELADDPTTQRRWLVIANANMGDWKDLLAVVSQDIKEADLDLMLVQSAFITPDGEGAEAFAKEALKTFSEERIAGLKGGDQRVGPVLARARYLWILGEKDAAKELVDGMAEEISASDDQGARGYSGTVTKLQEKIEAGEFPPVRTVNQR